MLSALSDTLSAMSLYCAILCIPSANASMAGPKEALMQLIRNERSCELEGFVVKDSRIIVSEPERSEGSVDGG